MSIKRTITTSTTFAAAILASTTTALAQITNPAVGEFGSREVAEDAASGSLFVRYFVELWNVFITVGAIVVIVMFLWGAIEWITAGSDTGKVQNAQKRIMNAALGIFVLVASFAIIQFISFLFFDGEFNILNPTLPSGNDAATGGTSPSGNPFPTGDPGDDIPI